MARIVYPSGLGCITEATIKTSRGRISVARAMPVFPKWTKKPVVKRENTRNGKAIVDYNGEPMFAELAIRSIAEASGWGARWMSSPGSTIQCLVEWKDKPAQQENIRIRSHRALEVLESVVVSNGNSYKGCWDVFAWKGGRVLFMEAKRAKHDALQKTQPIWLEAAVRAGVPLESFLLVEWTLTD